MAVLKKWNNGTSEWEYVSGPPGEAGTSAYAAAVAGGYNGTESEFNADLAAIEGLAAELAAI